MQILIVTLYLLFFCWLITLIPFFRKSGLPKAILLGLFLLKVAAGFAYAWYYALPQNIDTADTWKYYHNSLTETAWLLRDPVAFIKDLFYSPYQSSGNLFSGTASYWNDLKDNAIIKFLAVINVITDKNYYADLIIFNFFYFFGPMALYRLLQPFWNYNKLWLLIPVFLLPSFLFWCSGLHKDGFLFSAMMIAFYAFEKQCNQNKIQFGKSAVILLCFVVMFALRNIILLLMLPSLLALFISHKQPKYSWFIFLGLYGLGLILFFALPALSPVFNFPQYIINKQEEFNSLRGASKIIVPPLQPSVTGFVQFIPYALDIAFLQPHVDKLAGISYALAFLENTLLLLAVVVWIFCHKPFKFMQAVWMALLFFSVSVLLLCGYTVPFSGAVVRYKSLVTPLFFSFLVLSIDYRKLAFKKAVI